MTKSDFLKLDIQFFAAGTTSKTNLVIPEVMAASISAALPNAIRFAPLAVIDSTLVGSPGDTITVPKFAYIGDAKVVAEGAPIDLELLTQTTTQATVKKIAKGAEITDEARISGYGDPLGEIEKQMTMSIAAGVDNDALASLATTSLSYTAGTKWDIDTIDAAFDIFNDEDQASAVLLMNPKDAAKLRKAAAGDWSRATDLGDNIIMTGTFGGVLGAQVVRSRKLAENTAYLVKPGALKIYMKKAVDVESDRDIVRKTTVVTADEHFTTNLYDETKAIKIVITPGP